MRPYAFCAALAVALTLAGCAQTSQRVVPQISEPNGRLRAVKDLYEIGRVAAVCTGCASGIPFDATGGDGGPVEVMPWDHNRGGGDGSAVAVAVSCPVVVAAASARANGLLNSVLNKIGAGRGQSPLGFLWNALKSTAESVQAIGIRSNPSKTAAEMYSHAPELFGKSASQLSLAEQQTYQWLGKYPSVEGVNSAFYAGTTSSGVEVYVMPVPELVAGGVRITGNASGVLSEYIVTFFQRAADSRGFSNYWSSSVPASTASVLRFLDNNFFKQTSLADGYDADLLGQGVIDDANCSV